MQGTATPAHAACSRVRVLNTHACRLQCKTTCAFANTKCGAVPATSLAPRQKVAWRVSAPVLNAHGLGAAHTRVHFGLGAMAFAIGHPYAKESNAFATAVLSRFDAGQTSRGSSARCRHCNVICGLVRTRRPFLSTPGTSMVAWGAPKTCSEHTRSNPDRYKPPPKVCRNTRKQVGIDQKWVITVHFWVETVPNGLETVQNGVEMARNEVESTQNGVKPSQNSPKRVGIRPK